MNRCGKEKQWLEERRVGSRGKERAGRGENQGKSGGCNRLRGCPQLSITELSKSAKPYDIS